MKTGTYRNGRKPCKTYLKTVGNGWEVGFTYAGRPVFLGNFIHSSEAKQFYTLMRREISHFGRRYKVGKAYPTAWFKTFIGAHLRRCYYTFVTQMVQRHKTEAARTYGKTLRTYRRLNRRWSGKAKMPCLRAA